MMGHLDLAVLSTASEAACVDLIASRMNSPCLVTLLSGYHLRAVIIGPLWTRRVDAPGPRPSVIHACHYASNST